MGKKLSETPLVGENSKLENTVLGRYTEVGIFNFWENVCFSDYSYTGQFCFLQNAEIGKFVNIAAMVRIGPTAHPMDRPSQHHFTYRRQLYGFDQVDDEAFFSERESRKTIVGHDGWIGHGAILMPGIKIGNGAVIGSGAVITKDVAPYSVVVGAPGREIRKRFEDELIEKLESIAWWDWSHEKLHHHFKDFLLDTRSFVEKHGRK